MRSIVSDDPVETLALATVAALFAKLGFTPAEASTALAKFIGAAVVQEADGNTADIDARAAGIQTLVAEKAKELVPQYLEFKATGEATLNAPPEKKIGFLH